MFQGKDSACQCRGVQLPSLVREDPLEQEMATHSSLVAWEIPWTEEPGRLQSRGRKESDTTHNDEETAARWSGGGGWGQARQRRGFRESPGRSFILSEE